MSPATETVTVLKLPPAVRVATPEVSSVPVVLAAAVVEVVATEVAD